MSGYLSKKNSHGVWQRRYFCLNNEFLIYKKDSGSGPADIKGVVDISDISTISLIGKSDVDIATTGGEIFSIRAADGKEANKWISALNHRLDWVKREAAIENKVMESMTHDPVLSTGFASPQYVILSGWLMKKSPHKFGGLQV